jgi:hypothetical protein
MSSNSHSYTYQTRLNNLTSVQDDILDAYATHYNHVERRLYADMQKHGKPAYPSKHLGPSISYRFLKDTKGWRVMVTTEYPESAVVSIKHSGAFGIDINAGCLALAEINRHGNLVGTRVVPVPTYGKTSDQAEAIIGAAVKMIISQAKDAGKPLIIEKLNFKKKRAEREDASLEACPYAV